MKQNQADVQFQELCHDILLRGEYPTDYETRAKWPDGSNAYTFRLFGVINRYDLSKEFPLLTIRHVAIRGAIDELLWIWQKKSNRVDELQSRIWDAWKKEDGTIGKAYGYQLGIKHPYPEGEMDQVDRLLYDLKHNPMSRRMIVNMYNHADLHEMSLYPCAYMVNFYVVGGRLNAILTQRSADIIIANGWNVSQYAMLILLLAHVNNLCPGELVHVIGDAHIYDRHMVVAQKLITEPIKYSPPKIVLNPDIKNFYDFKQEDIQIINYQYNRKLTGLEIAE